MKTTEPLHVALRPATFDEDKNMSEPSTKELERRAKISATLKSRYPPLKQRFWAKVNKRTKGCWLWQASPGSDRALAYVDRKTRNAAVVAWELVNEAKVPKGKYVCHRCDNPRCVRPSHLFIGTQSENMLDCSAKGRIGRRESKLTIEIVRNAKDRVAAGETYAALAKEYKVALATIWLAVNGRTWRRA